MNKLTKPIALAVAGLLVGGAAGAGLHAFMAEPVVVEKEKIVVQNVTVPGPERIVTVAGPERVVQMDNGKLDKVLQAIWEAGGDASTLVEDLEESEIPEIADRAVFEIDARLLAEQAVRAEAFDLLRKEEFNGTEFDEDDLSRLKLEDDKGEIVLLSVDHDDKDAEVLVTARFEHDEVKFEADFIVLIKDGEVDDTDVEDIRLR